MTEHRVRVTEVQLEVVSDAEVLSVSWFWHQRVQIVIVACMLAEKVRTKRLTTHRSNLELQDELLLLTSIGQEERFSSMSALDLVLGQVVVDLDPWALADLERALITALSIVNVNHQVGCLACEEEVLWESHLHAGALVAWETNQLIKVDLLVKLRVVHDWAQRTDMHSLPVSDETLAILIHKHICVNGHELCLKQIAQFYSQRHEPLDKVKRLW